MSLCANVPPYRPALDIIPIAFVFSIQVLTDNTKLLLPDAFLIVPNSVQLKFGLYNISHSPRYSIVLFKLSQRKIICSCNWLRAISVREM